MSSAPEVNRYWLRSDGNDEDPHVPDWASFPGNQAFNNPVILDGIVSFLPRSEPIRQYRLINRASNVIVTQVLRKRGSVSLQFGLGGNNKTFKANRNMIEKFAVHEVAVSLTRPKRDVEWLANNYAHQLKTLTLFASFKDSPSLKILQDLLKNLTNLENLTFAVLIQSDLMDQLEFKIESVRKLSVFYEDPNDDDEVDLSWTRDQTDKLMKAFPNVEDFESAGVTPIHFFFSPNFSWHKMTALTLHLMNKEEESPGGVMQPGMGNGAILSVVVVLPPQLEKLTLVGSVCVEDVLHDALDRQAPTLKSLTLSIDMDEHNEDTIEFPILPNLKELELNGGKNKYYSSEVKLPLVIWGGDDNWWPNVFPQLEKLRIDLPIFKDVEGFFEELLPNCSDFEGPRNETLKKIEIRIPTTEEGNAWIQKFQANFRLYFPNALLTVKKYYLY